MAPSPKAARLARSDPEYRPWFDTASAGELPLRDVFTIECLNLAVGSAGPSPWLPAGLDLNWRAAIVTASRRDYLA
jgi:hypothetical protein